MFFLTLISFIYLYKTFQVLSEACKTDAYKRGTLCKLYEEAVEFFKQLDEEDFIMQNLHESLGDFITTLEENLENIKPRDQYVVLVAGKQFLFSRCSCHGRKAVFDFFSPCFYV